MIEALIFDFDGLILETEASEYRSWQEIYAEYQALLPLETWAVCIGSGANTFDPCVHLESLLGRSLPREELCQRRRERRMMLLAEEAILPGVENSIAAAKQRGMRLGVASSSSRQWVTGHLARFGLLDSFDCIRCRDDVVRTKPDPELYLAALDGLHVSAEQAIALEDSPNGVLAAQRAGIFCVAVPNIVTSQLPLDHADLRLASLAEMPLEELIALVERHKAQ
jgi:HAD superfamily hydrolase (TIGR01509 family)